MLEFSSPIEVTMFIIEMIGCISFATSGAIAAIRKKADILGIWILSLVAVFGGGLLRDLIINEGAPHIFWDIEYHILALVSIAISTFWFILGCFKKTAPFIDKHRHDFWIYLVDAIGIGIFCIYGVQTANNALPENITVAGIYVFDVTLGVITGVGGGMFRDVFIGEVPMVFKKHFYMTPCIVGSLVYTIMYRLNCNEILSIIVGVGIIVILRVLATLYKWNLPTAKAYNDLQK